MQSKQKMNQQEFEHLFEKLTDRRKEVLQKILTFDVSWLCTPKKFHWLVTSGMLRELWNIESCRRYWLMED
jgi:hypothetical protein